MDAVLTLRKGHTQPGEGKLPSKKKELQKIVSAGLLEEKRQGESGCLRKKQDK